MAAQSSLRASAHPPFMISTFAVVSSLLCVAIVFALCAYAKPICAKLDIMDVPGTRKHHKTATPLMGGLALQFAVIPIVVVGALFYSVSSWIPQILVLFGAVAAMTTVGLADDRHTLSARDRLVASFLVFGSAALLDPVFNVRLLSFEQPDFELGLGTGWLAVVFTTICCVGLVNAINMADGKNGLVIGLSLGWLLLVATRAPAHLLPSIMVFAGALLVLLFFNLKGRLFLGDGGSYGIATAIGLFAIATYNYPGMHAGRAMSAGEIMLLFAVPVLDSFRLTFSRLKRGQSPMAADRDHLHHHLQTRFGWPKGLYIYWLLSLAPSAILFALF